MGETLTEMTYLYKHCLEEHIPKLGGSLRVGTLSHFRKIEDTSTKDIQEGLFTVSVKFPNPVILSCHYLNEISFGAALFNFSDGSFSIRTGNLQTTNINDRWAPFQVTYTDQDLIISHYSDDLVEVSGEFLLSVEHYDLFIFCMSKTDATGSVISGRDAVWKLSGSNLESFSVKVMKLISERLTHDSSWLTKTNIGPVAGHPFNYSRSAEFFIHSAFWSDVNYMSKEILITNTERPSGNEILKILRDSIFIKPHSYSHENEFRICFRPVVKESGRMCMIPCHLNPVFVGCAPLLDFIEY